MAALSFPVRRRRLLAPSQCPECRGGGEVNGVPCRGCSGRRVQARRQLLPGLIGSLATAAGTAVRWSLTLPGLLGAAGVSYGAGVVVHSVFHQVPVLGVAVLAAGAFGLALDRRLP
jgi:hypothetical protein